MSEDVRGFRYPFQPLLERQRWQFEARQRELAKALQVQAAGKVELQDQHANRQTLLARVRMMFNRFDPVRTHSGLMYLCDLDTSIARLTEESETVAMRCADLQAECREQHARLEALERHRDRSLANRVVQQANRQAKLADQEWLARLHAQAGHTDPIRTGDVAP